MTLGLAKRARPRTGRPRILALTLVAAGALILCGSACGPVVAEKGRATSKQAAARRAGALPHYHAGQIIPPARDQSGWRVTYPIRLPAGYTTPTALTADPSGSGVWFFAAGRVDGRPRETLFEWSTRSGRLVAHPIDADDRALQAGGWTPIVVDRRGRAWVGINQTLVIIDPESSRVRTILLPPVTVGSRKRGLPGLPGPDPGRHAGIDALALGADGSIDVARDFSTEMQTVNPRTLHVVDVALPPDTVFAGLDADLAGDGGRTLAAVLYKAHGRHELGQYAERSWSVQDKPCAAYAARFSGRVVVVSGPDCVERGTDPGRRGLIVMSSVPVPRLAALPSALALSVSTTLSGTRHGLAVTTGRRSTLISLGRIVTGPPSGGGHPVTAPRDVAIVPGLMASIGAGRAWFVPQQGGTLIGLVRPIRVGETA
jgi:hypothetical protein